MNDWLEIIKSQLLNGRFMLFVLALLGLFTLRYLIRKWLNSRTIDTTQKYKARKAANILMYLIILVISLVLYSDKLGGIGITLGVAGAGIAFALQEVIVSIAGWINLMFNGTISVGQRVKIGEVKGDVIDISVLTTTIMETGDWIQGDLYNGRMVTIANSFVFNGPVHNYSGKFPFLWDEIKVPIRFESDYELTRTTLQNILNEICRDYAIQSEAEWKLLANKFNVEEARVKPSTTMSFDENWITFTLRYIVDYKLRRSTADKIYTRILEAVNSSEGKIRIASSSIEISQSKD